MVLLILQTDSSGVISIMIQDHQVVPQVPGMSAEHHNLSHHGQDPARIDQLRKIEVELVNCFAGLLTELNTRSEADRTLLESTALLFGSNLGNANSHDPRSLPILLAGGGFAHGSYVSCSTAGSRPLSNLFLTLLNSLDVEVDAFGQSTGTLTW